MSDVIKFFCKSVWKSEEKIDDYTKIGFNMNVYGL